MTAIEKYKIRLLMNICYKKITGKNLYSNDEISNTEYNLPNKEKFFKGYKPYQYFKIDKEEK